MYQQRCPSCGKVLAIASYDFMGTLALWCTRCKSSSPEADQVPFLHCACRKRLQRGVVEHGLLTMKCARCRALVSFSKEGPTGSKPRKKRKGIVGPRRRPGLSDEDLVARMEDRWQAMIAASSWTRAETAVGIRFRVFDRDGFRCRYCGKTPSDGITLQADHVVPRADGGEDTLDSLVTSCAPCNLGKSDDPLTSPLPST